MMTSYALATDMLTLAAGPLANLAFNLSNILHLSAYRDIIILCLTRCFRQVRCIALTSFAFSTTNAAESIESASSFVTTPAFSSATITLHLFFNTSQGSHRVASLRFFFSNSDLLCMCIWGKKSGQYSIAVVAQTPHIDILINTLKCTDNTINQRSLIHHCPEITSAKQTEIRLAQLKKTTTI